MLFLFYFIYTKKKQPETSLCHHGASLAGACKWHVSTRTTQTANSLRFHNDFLRANFKYTCGSTKGLTCPHMGQRYAIWCSGWNVPGDVFEWMLQFLSCKLEEPFFFYKFYLFAQPCVSPKKLPLTLGFIDHLFYLQTYETILFSFLFLVINFMNWSITAEKGETVEWAAAAECHMAQ